MRKKTILRKNEENRKSNRRLKTLIKNCQKDFRLKLAKISEIDISELKKAMIKVQVFLDRAASRGVIHKNNAARRKSKLFLTVKKLEENLTSERGE